MAAFPTAPHTYFPVLPMAVLRKFSVASRFLLMAIVLAATAGNLGAAPFPDVSKLPIQRELPDPLVMFSGQRVTTKEQWFKERRPELKALFQHYMYGYMPAAPDKI